MPAKYEWVRMTMEERDRLAEWSKKIDEIIDNESGSESEPISEDKIVREVPPLPELNTDKFAMKRGNDEVAMWLKQGRESGHLDETMIGIALMRYRCPMMYAEYPCNIEKENWKDLFTHFKNQHYIDSENTIKDQAKKYFYDYYVSMNTNQKTSQTEKIMIEYRASNPTERDLEPYIPMVERQLTWRDMAYAMLQECFVYEANKDTAGTSGYHTSKAYRAKYRKRVTVLYRMQKIYGLTTQHIHKMFFARGYGDNTRYWNEFQSLSVTRKMITDGMMTEHGNKQENLPQWMQNVLKKPR